MKVRVLITSALTLPLVFAGTVFAVENESNQTDQSVSTTSQTQPDTKEETLNQEQKTQLLERLNTRKAEAKLKLTTAQQKRLQTRCKNAQGLVKVANGRSSNIESNRSKIHTNLVERLTTLEAKLAAKNVATDTLKANITELQAKIATFNTDFAAYKQVLADVSNIDDCTTDPAAFKASLDAARVAMQKAHDDAVAIRTYIKDTVKPTLAEVRTALKESAETGAN